MTSEKVWAMDATAQAALVQAGELRPIDLVEMALDRISSLNPQINAVITLLPDEARRQALDPSLTGRPFGGVPILLKDAAQELAGTPYSIGTRLLRDMQYKSPKTTEFTQRLLRAGFVVVGKTNVPELSSGFTTEPAAFGPTRNPWHLSRTAGGSSGGSAAAVAAGMTAIAHGCDATGSLRVPGAACGVATLRPTSGLLPNATPAGQPDPLGLWCDFVLTRSVRDMTGVLAAVRGASRSAGPCPNPDRRVRAGLLLHDPLQGMQVHPDCVAAVEQAGKVLQVLGYEVDAAYPAGFDTLFSLIGKDLRIASAYVRAAQLDWLTRIAGRQLTEADISLHHLQAAEQGRDISTGEYEAAAVHIRSAVAPLRAWWRDGYDLLVTPTLRQPPWPLGLPDGPLHAGVFTFPASLTGQPAVSLPLLWTEDGLPVGVQVIADVGQDEALLTVAAKLEAARPWRDRWPSVAFSA